MARPKSNKINVEALQLLALSLSEVVDLMPLIAYVIFESGGNYREIAEVFGVNPSTAEYHVKNMEEALKS